MKNSKLSIKLPATKEKKPFLTSGSPSCIEGYHTDGNCNKIKLSPAGVLKIAKNTQKRLGVANYISYIEVIDHGDYYTYSAC